MNRIPRLHLISNRDIRPINQLPQIARSAVKGGVGAIHLRELGLPDDELSALYSETYAALNDTNALVVINRAIEVAIEVQSGALHLTEAQIQKASEVRTRLEPDALIGASVHSVETARQAEAEGVDYVIAGHVFATGSKPGQAGRGLRFVRDVAGAVRIPVIAIGGVTPENAASVVSSGAHGVAMMSAILAADDPNGVAASFCAAIGDRQADADAG